MVKCRFCFLIRLWQRQPQLQTVEAITFGLHLLALTLGVDDAFSGNHEIDRPGGDRQGIAQGVAVEHLALKQIGHRGQIDMRVRPHINTLAGRKFSRPHVIEKDEWAHHALLRTRQRTPHDEATQVMFPGGNMQLDRITTAGLGCLIKDNVSIGTHSRP